MQPRKKNIVDRTWMVCTSVGGCPSHLSLNSMQQWMEDQTEVTKRIERGFGHGVYAVTSTQWIVARWQSTTEDSGSLALRHTSTAKSDSQCQCSASISLLVAWTIPTDSQHPVSHPWEPRQEEVTLCRGHSLPQLVRFVLTGCKEPQEKLALFHRQRVGAARVCCWGRRTWS